MKLLNYVYKSPKGGIVMIIKICDGFEDKAEFKGEFHSLVKDFARWKFTRVEIIDGQLEGKEYIGPDTQEHAQIVVDRIISLNCKNLYIRKQDLRELHKVLQTEDAFPTCSIDSTYHDLVIEKPILSYLIESLR